MRNPETKRSFGLLGRYAGELELSSPTGVIREGATGFPQPAINHCTERHAPSPIEACNDGIACPRHSSRAELVAAAV